MKEIKESVKCTLNDEIIKYLPDLNDTMWFDIETTGLSASVSTIYLIGLIVFNEGNPFLIQLFADDLDSEVLILKKFLEIAATKKTLIHFNGSTFDIPFIEKRCSRHDIPCDLTCSSIDIYKEIRPYKNFFKMSDTKQKTVEALLNTGRIDETNGGELIKVYSSYIKLALTNDKNAKPLEDILLLHNHDDVIGMLNLTPLVAFLDKINSLSPESPYHSAPFDISCEIISEEKIRLKTTTPLKGLSYSKAYEGMKLSLDADGILSLVIDTTYDEMKFFYPDYKNYYYIPLEDTAIHKSIGDFLPKDHKKKATAATCYVRHKGRFIPCFINHAAIETFKREYKDKLFFIEVSKKFITNIELLSEYMYCAVNKIIKASNK